MIQQMECTFDWEEHMRKYPYLAKAISDYVHNNGCACNQCQLNVTTNASLLRKSKGGLKDGDN